MSTITTTIERPGDNFAVDPAELAAAALLVRSSGRTLGAYHHDLRNLFQWADELCAELADSGAMSVETGPGL